MFSQTGQNIILYRASITAEKPYFAIFQLAKVTLLTRQRLHHLEERLQHRCRDQMGAGD